MMWSALCLLACLASPEPARPLELPTATGDTLRLFASDDQTLTVAVFITVDCPVANGYAPTLHRLCERYEDRRVRLVLVHADRDVSAEAALRHAEEYGHRCPVLLDHEHRLVDLCGATVTPEAAVFDAEHRLAYLGRIDNRWEDYGVQRDAPTTHELTDAVDALLAGQRPPVARAKAVGCPIPDLG